MVYVDIFLYGLNMEMEKYWQPSFSKESKLEDLLYLGLRGVNSTYTIFQFLSLRAPLF